MSLSRMIRDYPDDITQWRSGDVFLLLVSSKYNGIKELRNQGFNWSFIHTQLLEDFKMGTSMSTLIDQFEIIDRARSQTQLDFVAEPGES